MIGQLVVAYCCLTLADGFSVDTTLRVDGSCPPDIQYEDVCPSGENVWRLDSVCTDVASIIRPGLRVCLSPVSRKFRVTIGIEVAPQQVSQTQGSLWMSGRGPALSWGTAIQVAKDPLRQNGWKVEIDYTMDSDSTQCLSTRQCTELQNALEFRLNLDKGLGPSGDMLGPNFFIPLPLSNSLQGFSGRTSAQVTVYPWFRGARRQIKQHYASFKGMDAHFSILLPPSFDSSVRQKKYPLVVVLGPRASQVLPQLIDAMYNETLVDEAVVIFIDSWGPETQDLQCNYSPYQQGVVWKCKDYTAADDGSCGKRWQTCWDSDATRLCSLRDPHTEELYKCRLISIPCRPGGELLLEFISKQLVDVVQAETNKRVMFDPPRHRVSLIGHGITGLLSCHAAVTRPDSFGNVACLSAPFYWPLDHTFSVKFGFRKALALNVPLTAAQRGLHCTQKYYIDVGEYDDSHLPQEVSWPVRDAREMIDMMKRHYMLKENENILFSVVPKASNNHYADLYMDSENLFRRLRIAFRHIMRPEGGLQRKIHWITANTYEAVPNNSSVKVSGAYSCTNGISLLVFLCSVGKKDAGLVML